MSRSSPPGRCPAPPAARSSAPEPAPPGNGRRNERGAGRDRHLSPRGARGAGGRGRRPGRRPVRTRPRFDRLGRADRLDRETFRDRDRPGAAVRMPDRERPCRPSPRDSALKRALVIMAAIAGLLLGGLYEHAFMTRSRLQLAADSAAEAGAGAGAAGRDVRQAAEARLALFPQLRAAAVDIEWPPGAGRYRGSNNAVRVTIRGR